MAENINATCDICGEGYHMCLSCKNAMKARPWQTHTCCAEHYKVFQVVRGLNTGVYTKNDAKKLLENIDLSDLKNFNNDIKRIINSIIKENKVRKVSDYNDNDGVSKKENEVVNNVDLVNEEHDNVDSSVI